MSVDRFFDGLMVMGPRSADGGKSAYAYAVEGGYMGTEKEFAERLAFLMNGAVVGYMEGTQIVLSGNLAPGDYTFTYLVKKADGTTETVTIGTYTVEDETETKTYTITWVNYDGTVLEIDEEVPEGEIPKYNGATPTRPDNNQYIYTFKGWDKTVVAAVADATYTATYTQTAKPVEPSYTNLLKLEGVGYKEGYKISTSSGTESLESGADVTGYIPIPADGASKTLRIANISLSGKDGVNNVVFYNESKTMLGYWRGSAGAFEPNVTAKNGIYSFTPADGAPSTRYIRFSCGNIDENSIVTLGEEIV